MRGRADRSPADPDAAGVPSLTAAVSRALEPWPSSGCARVFLRWEDPAGPAWGGRIEGHAGAEGAGSSLEAALRSWGTEVAGCLAVARPQRAFVSFHPAVVPGRGASPAPRAALVAAFGRLEEDLLAAAAPFLAATARREGIPTRVRLTMRLEDPEETNVRVGTGRGHGEEARRLDRRPVAAFRDAAGDWLHGVRTFAWAWTLEPRSAAERLALARRLRDAAARAGREASKMGEEEA